MTFPRRAEDLTAGWLEEQLGTEVRDFRSDQIAVGVGLIGSLHRIHLDGDGPASVVAKFPVEDPITRDHVATPLRAYQTEVGYYRDGETTFARPRVHAAEIDEGTGDFVLLLEDLDGLRSEDQLGGCSIEDARLVLAELARHHAHHAVHGGPAARPWLVRFDDPVRQQVVAGMTGQSVAPFLAGFGAGLDGDLRQLVEGLGSTIPTFMAIHKEPNVTVAHCDVRLDNMFFGGADRPVVLLDWQLAGIGGIAYDVAYFLSQSLTTGERRVHERSLVDGYFDALRAQGCPLDEDAFWIDYRRTLAFCISYAVTVGGQVDLANERARVLCHDILDRAVAAISDHDALAVWPAG